MNKAPGQVAYEAYCGATNWKSLVSGLDLPQWNDVKPEIKEAWVASEAAVIAAENAKLDLPLPPDEPEATERPAAIIALDEMRANEAAALDKVVAALIQAIVEQTGISEEQVERHTLLSALDIDSLDAVETVIALEELIDVGIDDFDFNEMTVEGAAQSVVNQLTKQGFNFSAIKPRS